MRQRVVWGVFIGALVLLSGCNKPFLNFTDRAAERVRKQDLGSYPYHPVVFHLDLATLSYHLYSQSLVWPWDPYYEDADDRDAAMAQVWKWASKFRHTQAKTGLEAIRGPGGLAGLPSNKLHDPILFRYSGIDPHVGALSSDGSVWSEFQPVPQIADRIGEVWVSRRVFGSKMSTVGPITSTSIEVLRVDEPESKKKDAKDLLIAFEGATGDKGEKGQNHSQSLMGFSLVRSTGKDSYDVHIVFRGSRSGSPIRAAMQASGTEDAHGNPDWITDLGFRVVKYPLISAQPEHLVARGMAHSIDWTIPQILSSLDRVVGSRRKTPPTSITVVGHSLGGALAQFFVSAMLLGDRYGPGGEGTPPSLRKWPWKKLKLVTLGAPRVGNRVWAEELTTGVLESRFYETHLLTPYDVRASGMTSIDLVPRMTNPNRPLVLRVLIPSDAVTSGRPFGEHVGHTVYLEHPTYFSIADGDSHEPQRMRKRMLEALKDPRIPPAPWVYHELEKLTPTRGDDDFGGAAEYGKMSATVQKFFEKAGSKIWNADRFKADVKRFLELALPAPDSE